MNAIQYRVAGEVRPIRLGIPQSNVKARVGRLLRVVAEAARGADFDAVFSHRSGAQFASLSRGQQNALLDRGYGPR